ncbi:MAG: hypothetical protein KDJ47_05770 [Hyphomicrobiaceae bacterium]|nr:hypothetical protein [Hyphomicrobiaceae bacterium]
MTLSDHDELTSELVQTIAARPDLRVTFKQDSFGKQWLEVRSGRLGLRVARIVISPRYIQMLQQAVTAKEKLEVAG